MPRPKKTPTYIEGPEAAENFRRALERAVHPRRPVLQSEPSETTEVTISETVSETLDIAVKRPRQRRIK